MSGFVEVLSPGLYSSIQDRGRIGYRKYGVPTAGTMDRQSAGLANQLLNNSLDAALMEITLSGPKLLFSAPTQITISGANISPLLNKNEIACNKIITVTSGDILSFGLLRFGSRCYLAIKGGFQVAKIMGSRSYFSPVTLQQTIRKGDRIPFESYYSKDDSFSLVKNDDSLFRSSNLKCSLGPEFELLIESQKKSIFETSFLISKDNNRMGYRLDSSPIQYPTDYNMLTSSVMPGTVQLTPSGQLIALMNDCQTTGGYPRILQLTTSAINVLAQKKSSDSVLFEVDTELN